MREIRIILGDQLNRNHSWYKQVDSNVLYLMAEVKSETDYVVHHIQKITAFFLAMRDFADWLDETGHNVKYFRLHDHAHPNFTSLVSAIVQDCGASHLSYQEPDEYRLHKEFDTWSELLPGVSVRCVSSEHFMASRDAVQVHFKGKKQWVMESFYRSMRKKYDVLMEGYEPLGGKWNYDADNRKKIPLDTVIPDPLSFHNATDGIPAMLKSCGVNTLGEIGDTLIWPINRVQALELLEYFCTHLLTKFGHYQDALHPTEWSLFHSRMSFALNTKIVHPLEVIERVEQAHLANPEEITLPQAEGYIRQILGWREYVRGIYWAKMPEYASLNFFNHQGALPDWFWTGKTKMACLKHAIDQSLQHSYAHHIQRLMLTGNFASLIGAHPDEVDRWYLGIYIDAIEWVEMPNTRGMSQYADGGIMGTKPYVSSANYIQKMSHYCGNCAYNPKNRLEDDACPFNALYWAFYLRHEESLKKNPRIGMVYRNIAKMDADTRNSIRQKAGALLENLNQL